MVPISIMAQFEKPALDVLELMIKSKKRSLSGFSGNFLRNLFGGAIAFLISLKGALIKNRKRPFLNAVQAN